MRAGLCLSVAAAFCGMRTASIPAGSGLLPRADVPDRQRRDGPPEPVIRGKHPVRAVPVLSRRRDKVRQTIEKLKWREFDDAVGPRPRGLAAAAGPDPVGGLVPWQHVAESRRPQPRRLPLPRPRPSRHRGRGSAITPQPAAAGPLSLRAHQSRHQPRAARPPFRLRPLGQRSLCHRPRPHQKKVPFVPATKSGAVVGAPTFSPLHRRFCHACRRPRTSICGGSILESRNPSPGNRRL